MDCRGMTRTFRYTPSCTATHGHAAAPHTATQDHTMRHTASRSSVIGMRSRAWVVWSPILWRPEPPGGGWEAGPQLRYDTRHTENNKKKLKEHNLRRRGTTCARKGMGVETRRIGSVPISGVCFLCSVQ